MKSGNEQHIFGKQYFNPPHQDEDDEGRNENERLVEEGIAGADHDQMLQASLE